jgi:hypothetical protein
MRGIVGIGGFDANDVQLRVDAMGCNRGSANQATTANWGQNRTDLRVIFQKFQRSGSCSGHNMRVIIGRHQRQAALFRNRIGKRLAVVGQAIIEDNLGIIPASCGNLHGRGIVWHTDHGWSCQEFGC